MEARESVESKKNIRSTADFLGVWLSLLCLVHCLALPFLIAFAPVLLRNVPGDDVTHRGLAVVIGFVGFLAFRSGYKVHRRRWLLGLFVLGLLLISVAAVFGDAVLTNYGEAAITVGGGLLLVTAHLFNHSFCRSCVVHDCSHSCPPAETEVKMLRATSTGSDRL
jgi:peptidoglycan/LPS O-acetylase OafA/YrhL